MFNITTQTLAAFDGEPRILDLDLASALGLSKPLNVRPMIAANREELETHGEVFTRHVKTTAKGGRPGKAYYLTQGQALVICALSRTPKAAEIRNALIIVFLDWRREAQKKTVAVRAHNRRPPQIAAPTPASRIDHYIGFFKAYRDQPEALAEWAVSLEASMINALGAFSGDRRLQLR